MTNIQFIFCPGVERLLHSMSLTWFIVPSVCRIVFSANSVKSSERCMMPLASWLPCFHFCFSFQIELLSLYRAEIRSFPTRTKVVKVCTKVSGDGHLLSLWTDCSHKRFSFTPKTKFDPIFITYDVTLVSLIG